MSAATPPQHGERRCYLRGCRRSECIDANKRYCKRYRVNRHRNGPLRVDAKPFAEIVHRYADIGWSRRQIADLAGVSDTTIIDLLSGEAQRLNPDTATALRSLPAEPIDVPGRAYFDATGTIRRGRALFRIGHQVDDMAAELGLHPDSLSLLLHGGRGLVLASTAHNMTALYKKLRWTPGRFLANRTRGGMRDWHGPLDWDDATIDDPAATPEASAAYTSPAKYRRDPLRRGEIEHLYLLGESVPSIAKQLGGNERYISDRVDDIIRERQAKAQQERLAAKQRTDQPAAA
ncbi:hypothetical protein [Streptomyces flavidovirens]